MNRKSALILSILSVFLLILSGCNMPQKVVDPQPPVESTPEIIAEATEELPTETPTPLPRDKVAFVTSEAAPGVSENIGKALERLCASEYECQTVSSVDAIPEGMNYIVLAAEPENLNALIERNPGCGFVLVAAPGTTFSGAWTILYDDSFLPFLAGFAVENNAYDWRGVGLIPNDSAEWGTHAEEAFVNGGHYMCGNCRSVLAPYVTFPLVISEPGSSSPDTWGARVDEAQRSIVYTAFLSDEAMSEALLQKLMTMNVNILGTSAAPAGLENNWLATINFDWEGTLRLIFAGIKSGSAEGAMGTVLSLTPGALTSSFSDGKVSALRRVYDELLSGKLTAYTPITEYTE